MRVIALLSLLFGSLGLGLLDGQTFTHAVMGVIFGAAAFTCSLKSARKDLSKTYRWEGRVMAALGMILVIACLVQLPSAYRFQKKFNEGKNSAESN
jgi:tellurite resistance protein TehA-like permease